MRWNCQTKANAVHKLDAEIHKFKVVVHLQMYADFSRVDFGAQPEEQMAT